MSEIEGKMKFKLFNFLSLFKSPAVWIRLAVVSAIIAMLIVIAVLVNLPADGDVPTSSSSLMFESARVTAVLNDNAQPDYENAEGRRVGNQELELEIVSGSHKGEIMTTTNYMSALFNVDLKKGDSVIVRIMTDEDGSYYASVFNYDRGVVVGAFVLAFFIMLVLLGRKKGLGALIGLLFTLVSVWFILIPCIIRGIPAIPVTVAVVALTAAGALVLLNGFSKKTFCAIVGCVLGVVIAGVSAEIVGLISPMNGFNMSEAENLLLYGADKGLKISGLLVCGVIISALGAVMDVSLGIASSIWELHKQNPSLKSKQLYISGMQIGRDAMGTMANTLILAFAGSSLNMLILVQTYDIPFLQLINTDYICIEIIQSIACSIGILLSTVIVAFVSAGIMSRAKSER